MNAEEILALRRPEQLFSGLSIGETKREYFALAKKWHPDMNADKNADKVFAHINKLHEAAVEKIDSGIWGFAGVAYLESASGNERIVRYHSEQVFELGRFYVGDEHVTYVLDKAYEDFWLNATAMTRKFKFQTEEMAREISPCLPDPTEGFVTDKGEYVIIVSKPKKWLLLRDVLDHYGGTLDPRHVAWITSRLFNIASYLHWSKITHNEISPETIFIDPVDHKAALLGGWWYAVPAGRALKHVSKRTHAALPWKVRVKKRASRTTDLELVKATGLDLLGKGRTLAPKEMVAYLGAVATKNAFNEYKDWSEVLVKSFGARRFTIMELTPEQLYPKR